MATFREHLKQDIVDLQAKLAKLEAEAPHLLDTEILKLREFWSDISEHFWNDRVGKEQAESEAKTKVGALPEPAPQTAAFTS